jgi:hypothetical protein
MVSQLTRRRILENAKKQAESNAVKIEETKPVVEKEESTKKTDAEKLKKKKE